MSEEETARRAKGLAAEFFNNGDAEEIRISIRVSTCCPRAECRAGLSSTYCILQWTRLFTIKQ